MGALNVQNGRDGYDDLLANIRRLTVIVLDNLEAGTKDRTLDRGQKRLLSSTGARLLRLWRIVLRKGASQRAVDEFDKIGGLLPECKDVRQEGLEE